MDPERSAVGPLLELASVSRVEAVDGQIRLDPDLVLMGRIEPRLGAMQSLEKVRQSSPAFEKALRHVDAHKGKVVLHQGLLVLRVDDVGFRTKLLHHLDQRARPLGGPYLAVTRDKVKEVNDMARKEGYSPRRVS